MEFYTVQEIAEMLKISYEKALNLVKYSGVSYVKVGRQYRVSKRNFSRFFEKDVPVFVDTSVNI